MEQASESLRPHGLNSPWDSPGQNTGVGSLSLLQGIFPTQGSNPCLLHCAGVGWGGVVLYQLSYQGIPIGVHVSLFHTKYFCQGRLCGWIRTWWKERWENKKWDSFCNFGEILEEFYISKTRFVAGRLRRQGFWLGQLAWTKAEGWAVSLVCGY